MTIVPSFCKNTRNDAMDALNEPYEPLIRRIREEGRALPGGVVLVDSFLNQRVDMTLTRGIGEEFALRFKNIQAGCVMTAESSGIAPACMTALAMGLPLVICKKHQSKTARDERLTTSVHSFTKDATYELSVAKAFVPEGTRVLFIDDFLAMGEAALGAARLIGQAGATLAGIGIVIEKTFQPGRAKLETLGIPIASLARIAQTLPGEAIRFV